MKLAHVLLTLLLVAPAAEARHRTSSRPRRLAQRPAATRPQPAAQPPQAARPAQSTPPAAAQTPPPPPAGANLTAEQVAAQVQAFYDRTNDFEADFVQESRNRLYGRTERRQGHVRFRKPGRMRWDYTTPAGDVIVSDGTTLWAYEAAARQAVQSNLQQSQLPSALSFMTGTGRLANDFTFRLLNAQQYRYPSGYVLELRPIRPNPSFERILFYVAGGSFQVARTLVVDAQGNTNRFDFINPRVNMNHPDSVFHWSPPRGTQVVRP